MDNSSNDGGPSQQRAQFGTPALWLVLLFSFVVVVLYFASNASNRSTISYGTFRAELEKDNIAEVEFHGQEVYGKAS